MKGKPADEFAAENMPEEMLDPALDPPVGGTTVELWEDNAGGLHLVGGAAERVWYLWNIPTGATFAEDSLAMQAGEDDDWRDDLGELEADDRPTAAQFHAEREAEANDPNGLRLVAVRTPDGRIEVTDASRGIAATLYLGLECEA